MNKEFLSFITASSELPIRLKADVLRDIQLGLRGKSIVMKFISFQLLGALITLSFCPQFGLGLADGHGITHIFRMIGDWACAAFCGSLFLSAGAVMAILGMKADELWWVWRRFKYSLFLLPGLMWAALMLLNVSLELTPETWAYHLIWIAAAVSAEYLILKTTQRRNQSLNTCR